MKNDYLWDKSGTPDPAAVRLETHLRDLRHSSERPAWLRKYAASVASEEVTPVIKPSHPKPRPAAKPVREWRFGRGWGWPVPQAAFALLAVGCLAGGLWMAWQTKQTQGLAQVREMAQGRELASVPDGLSITSSDVQRNIAAPRPQVTHTQRIAPHLLSAVRTVRPAKLFVPVKMRSTTAVARRLLAQSASQIKLTPAEAAKAKADLMIALHIINDKLDLAQRNLEGHTLRLPELTDAAR